MVQWLGLHATKAGGLGSIPGQGTRSHMPLLRPGIAKERKKERKKEKLFLFTYTNLRVNIRRLIDHVVLLNQRNMY